ncbi:unnamed protein product [Clavelina lepadiformis]|uniref:CCHC-type domain-containing protein n=1 Tax=Clavelina lepadiformis TaxID=159417 RepID=A0ABP0FLL7_CLALP
MVIENALKQMALPNSSYRGRDSIKGLKDGRRIFKVLKKDLEAANPPRFIYFGPYRFTVQYEGQVKSCYFCAETGHLVKECPHRGKKQEEVNENSWKRAEEGQRTSGETPANKSNTAEREDHYLSKDEYPELSSNFKLCKNVEQNRHSSPLPESKPPKLQKIVDHYDGSIIEISEADLEKEERKRNRDPSSTDEYPMTQKPKEDELEEEMSYNENTNNYSEQIYEGEIVCSCNETLQQPGRNEIIQCTNCSKLYYLCHCSDNNLRVTHRFKQQTCETCGYTYVPDNLKLNATATV